MSLLVSGGGGGSLDVAEEELELLPIAEDDDAEEEADDDAGAFCPPEVEDEDGVAGAVAFEGCRSAEEGVGATGSEEVDVDSTDSLPSRAGKASAPRCPRRVPRKLEEP